MKARMMRIVWFVAAAILWMQAEAGLVACPVCFQVEESAVVDGVRVAVLVLASITTTVLAGFVMFARRVARAQRVDR